MFPWGEIYYSKYWNSTMTKLNTQLNDLVFVLSFNSPFILDISILQMDVAAWENALIRKTDRQTE